jgi:hypothetical protein
MYSNCAKMIDTIPSHQPWVSGFALEGIER